MNRRGLIIGLGSLIAAPAVVRVTSIMPVKALPLEYGRSPMMDAIELMAEHQKLINDLFLFGSMAWKEDNNGIFRIAPHEYLLQ